MSGYDRRDVVHFCGSGYAPSQTHTGFHAGCVACFGRRLCLRGAQLLC
jgi:hypothetical protein